MNKIFNIKRNFKKIIFRRIFCDKNGKKKKKDYCSSHYHLSCFKKSNNSDHILTTNWALIHFLSTLQTTSQMSTFQNNTFNR